MKKYIISILAILFIALSGCTGSNVEPDINITDGATLSQDEGLNYVQLHSVTATDYEGNDISPFIEVSGEYDLDVPGTYEITLTVRDGYGNEASRDVYLSILEITCDADPDQEKCIDSVTGIAFNDQFNSIEGIYLDTSTRILVDITPLNADNTSLTYHSSNEEVLSISQNGYIFGKSVGVSTITVKSVDGGFTITKEIEVYPKTCDMDNNQDMCHLDVLDNKSRLTTVSNGNVSGTDYKEVYVNNKVYYQIYVRTWADSDGNRKGDFTGIKDNLPYLKDLGIGGIWLMPINTSRSDHGYEVDDYYDVESDYGTMAEFDALLAEADLLGIDIILDLVINHMGAYNPIFQDVLENGIYSDYYDWFSWLDSSDTRSTWGGSWGQTIWYNPSERDWLIKNDAFTIHSSLQNKLYCGYFSDWMPDLNLENPEVRQYLKDVAAFWLNKGVKGFRMDATSHFYGTNEHFGLNNHEENVDFLTEYFDYLETVNPDVWVVVEAWEGYSTYASYTASGVSAINFESNYKIKEGVNNNYRYLAENINNVYNTYSSYNQNFIDAPFISHHDQLGRIASDTNATGTRMAAEILLTLQGNPIIYYGDEVGMYGGENSRNNMNWGDYYSGLFIDPIDYFTPGVDEQLLDPDSLLNTYKDLLDTRNNSLALTYGNFIPYESGYLEGYIRAFENGNDKEAVLVLFNFSSTFYLEVPSEITSYEILYQSNDTNFGGLSPKSTLIIEIPWDVYENIN